MKNITDSFVSLVRWSFAGSFGFNTDILATNPINLSVVVGVLIFFGKGVCAGCLFQEDEWEDNPLSLSDLLDNRKLRILNTIRNSEELQGGAIERLEKARARLRKVEGEADQFRANGYSEIEREKLNLIKSTYNTLEELENYKNESIRFGHQRAVQQVRQQVFQQVLKGARGALNSSLNKELHLRTISDNIDTFEAMEEITD
uniref:ATP synthase subunit b, chloroplastic n=1 Tax=Xanthoceras sorbifolium TaxID=99658 RepID=A0A2P1FU90_9ROSI|nr:ATP synthase CF0 subunit I [Xanthoceras sorbifolium]AVM38909.1 ATP synthase CF0 subunit I [Xanthoceras sorbifolium]QIM59453.1 AtpF [Xanthoceras sorbifolium]QMJ95876.1 ATP synthase CF0 subunit I [Xanthoceras sorbifolium]